MAYHFKRLKNGKVQITLDDLGDAGELRFYLERGIECINRDTYLFCQSPDPQALVNYLKELEP